MKDKVKEWIKRYLPAEILSVIFTLISSVLAYKITKSYVSVAIIGTWAGNIGYFGYILAIDIKNTKLELSTKNQYYTFNTFGLNLRALFIEFGIAEMFDSLLIRPTLMYYFPLILENIALGVMMAKVTADVTFYVPAIIGYEYSKRKLRNFN